MRADVVIGPYRSRYTNLCDKLEFIFLLVLTMLGILWYDVENLWRYVEMLANRRHEIIMNILRAEGAVTVSHLVEAFDVSLETVRRDLLLLEKEGVLRRVHGGAVSLGEMMPYKPPQSRQQDFNREKEQLCQNAAELVCEGDYIAIGTGTTPVHFAQTLKKRFRKLTVVTYSFSVFEVLSDMPDYELILLGGQYMHQEQSFSGQLTLDALKQLRVMKSFVFPSAISMEHGIFGFEQTLYPLQRQLLDCCDQAYILADSSKFERKALYKVADMRKEFIYVTDPQLPEELAQIYRDNGLQVITGRIEA